MGGERSSTPRMRERGQICCICHLPLAPPHPYRERRCRKCDRTHRVYLHSHVVKGFWVVQYLEGDLQSSIGRMFHYTDLNRVRELLNHGNVEAGERESFEHGIRAWGIGACFIALTPEQYKKLKSSRTVSVPKLKR